MTRRTRQVLLSIVVLLCAEMLAVILLDRDVLRDPRPPESMEGKAAWLAEHPADWLTASTLADVALDSESPHRFELWRAAYAHAKHLAPYRRNPDAAFLRAGLFHWYELPPRDRAAVLQAAAPLMREPSFFARVYIPLWELTRDFAWLRANAPDTMEARTALRDLAVARGRFAEYRTLREDLRRRRLQSFAAQRTSADPGSLVEMLPDRLATADEPLIRGILEEFEHKAFDPDRVPQRVELLVGYTVDHDLQPMTGILPLLETPSKLRDVTRARAAVDLNNASLATRIEITTAVSNAPEWEAYYLDRARFEAKRHDAAAANAYLVRASMSGISLRLLAAGEDVSRLLGNSVAAADYHAQVLARAREPRAWSGTCAKDELCSAAWFDTYAAGGTLHLDLAPLQSDEIPPYVEIYVDDALSAEGALAAQSAFDLAVRPGLHRVEVRLVNPRTRNGIQRRVRLS